MKNQLKDNTCSKEEAYEILRDFIVKELALSQRKSMDEDSFTKPSWDVYQAYQLGFQKALHKVNSFIPDKGKSIE